MDTTEVYLTVLDNPRSGTFHALTVPHFFLCLVSLDTNKKINKTNEKNKQENQEESEIDITAIWYQSRDYDAIVVLFSKN